MLSSDTKVRQVKVPTHDDIRKKKIRSTTTNRALIEVMLELADEDLSLQISEAELSMLTGVYLDLKRAAPFSDLRKLVVEDPGVRAFWAGVKNVTKAEEKLRGPAWVSAYDTWAKGAVENKWWTSPWGAKLLSFVERERLMAYGYKLMPKPPGYLQ